MLQSTGKEQELKAVAGGEPRRFGLPLQNGELMTKEYILENEFGFGRRGVLEHAVPHGRSSRE